MAHVPPEQSSGRGGGAERALGIASSLAGIAGFGLSLASGQLLWLLLGGGVAAFLLYAAWRRHWPAFGASLVVLLLLAAGGVLAYQQRHAGDPDTIAAPGDAGRPAASGAVTAPTTGPAGSPVTAGSGVDPTTAGVDAAGTPPARTAEITLPRHGAVDIDRPNQPVVADQIGATGAFDLYHDAADALSDVIRTRDGIFVYPVGTPAVKAYVVCGQRTRSAYNPVAPVQMGIAFCFRTTDGRPAWARITAVGADDHTAVLSVQVWDHAEGVPDQGGRAVEVTLARGTGVDLDAAGTAAKAAAGPTGELDLYVEGGPVMSDRLRGPDVLYLYPVRSRENARALCADYSGPNPSAKNRIDFVAVQVEIVFCFTTTEGRLGVAKVLGTRSDTGAAVLDVRVWDR